MSLKHCQMLRLRPSTSQTLHCQLGPNHLQLLWLGTLNN